MAAGNTRPEGDVFRIDGVVIGTVQTVEGDPEDLGRILVDFPTLGIRSNWARMTSFFAGKNRGAFFPPAPEDEVLVAFELGNINRPVVIGALWNGQDTPPVPAERALTQKMIRTSNGIQLLMDDTEGALKIELTDGQGNQFVIDTATKSVAIQSQGDISLKTEAGKVSIAGAEVELTATGKLSLSGTAEAALRSDGETTVTGTLVKLN